MNIKQGRESKKLTQKELAEALNVKRSTVAMWETGKSMPRPDKLPTIAKLFECTIEDLLANKAANE